MYKLPNGTWRGLYTVGWTSTGKPIRRSVHGATRTEAAEKLREALHRFHTGAAIVSGTETTGTYLDRWLAQRVKGTVTESTYERYTEYIRTAKPQIGHVKLRDLRPAHIQAMYAAMSAQYQPATLSRLRAVLHHAFEGAVEWDLLSRNPVDYATPPKVVKKDRTVLSVEQARHLFAVTADDPWEALWVTLATTGMRIGEALSLTWADVGPDTITVRKGKTKAAARTIPLFAETKAALARQRTRQLELKLRNRDIWEETGHVFTTVMGTRQHPETAWRLFKRALSRAELPDMRLHDLRRTAVAWMREAGIDADVVQVLIGHENIATTLDVYGSVNRARITDARRKMDGYLQEGSA